jgi:hypothetical protein
METYYKITRHDDVIQYATKSERCNEYFLNGYGFGIVKFDAKSVEQVDSIPVVFKEGYAYFDESNVKFRALVNVNDKWNGWAVPYIHESSIKKFMKSATWEEQTYKLLPNGDLYTVEHSCGDVYEQTITPEIINGEKYYYIGLGLCFNFKENKYKVIDVEGLVYDDDNVTPLKKGDVVVVKEWGYNKWQALVKTKNGEEHYIDSDRIKLTK